MALALVAIGMCCCSSTCAWFLPPVEKVDVGKDSKFFRLASGRAIYDPNSLPIDCTSKDKKVKAEDVARMQCEFDWTCKGYNVWKEVIPSGFEGVPDDEKWWVLKSKTPPDAWRSIPGYFMKKTDSKIYLRKE